MYLNLMGLTPRQRLAAVERDTTLEMRQEMRLDSMDEVRRLCAEIIGRPISIWGIMNCNDWLRLCAHAIEQDEQAAADAHKPAPPGIGAESADAKAENYFYHGTRGPR